MCRIKSPEDLVEKVGKGGTFYGVAYTELGEPYDISCGVLQDLRARVERGQPFKLSSCLASHRKKGRLIEQSFEDFLKSFGGVFNTHKEAYDYLIESRGHFCRKNPLLVEIF